MYNLQEKKEIAERIQRLRNAKGLTQKEMAKLLDISYNTYIKLEYATHGITIENLIKISSALNVTTDLILFGDTGKKDINFDDYILCARQFSDDGLNSLESSFGLIRKLRETAQIEQIPDEQATKAEQTRWRVNIARKSL